MQVHRDKKYEHFVLTEITPLINLVAISFTARKMADFRGAETGTEHTAALRIPRRQHSVDPITLMLVDDNPRFLSAARRFIDEIEEFTLGATLEVAVMR